MQTRQRPARRRPAGVPYWHNLVHFDGTVAPRHLVADAVRLALTDAGLGGRAAHAAALRAAATFERCRDELGRWASCGSAGQAADPAQKKDWEAAHAAARAEGTTPADLRAAGKTLRDKMQFLTARAVALHRQVQNPQGKTQEARDKAAAGDLKRLKAVGKEAKRALEDSKAVAGRLQAGKQLQAADRELKHILDIAPTLPKLPDDGPVEPAAAHAAAAGAKSVASWGQTISSMLQKAAGVIAHAGEMGAGMMAEASPAYWVFKAASDDKNKDGISDLDQLKKATHEKLAGRYGETAAKLIEATGSVIGIVTGLGVATATGTLAAGIGGATITGLAAHPYGRLLMATPALVLAEGVRAAGQLGGAIGGFFGRLFGGKKGQKGRPPATAAQQAHAAMSAWVASFGEAEAETLPSWDVIHREARRLAGKMQAAWSNHLHGRLKAMGCPAHLLPAAGPAVKIPRRLSGVERAVRRAEATTPWATTAG